MRESTAKWLNPMLEAASAQHIDTGSLMFQASMPAAEAVDRDHPARAWERHLAEDYPVQSRAVDWIRFGELLREQLGWADYPEWPDPEP
jgi:hypothetical protein